MEARIMIVEDERIVAEYLRASVTGFGYAVTSVLSSGEEVLERIEEDTPDLLLIDIVLEGSVNGIDLADRIRKLYGIPVVYVTAYADEDTLNRVKITEPYGYIVKPVDERELRSVMEIALYKISAERKIKRLNDILRAIRNVNQLITREKDTAVLLGKACEELVDTRGYHNAWIVLIDNNGKVVGVYSSGFEPEIEKSVEALQGALLPEMEGSVLDTHGVIKIENSQTAFCADIPGSGGALACCIRHGNEAYGILSVCVPQGLIVDEEEMGLIHEISGDIAFALHSIGLEAKRASADEALRKSEERYRNIFENAEEGIFQSTPEGGYITVNPAFARMFGFDSPEQMIQEVSDIGKELYVNGEDRERIKEILHRDRIASGFEAQMHNRKGGTFWISINAKAITDSDGRVLFYDGFVSDITRQKKAQSEQTVLTRRLEGLWRLTEYADADYYDFSEIVLAEILDITASRYGFYGFVDQDEKEMVAYGWSKGVKNECTVAGSPMVFPVENAGIWADAVRFKKPVVMNDYNAPYPSKKGTPEGHVVITRILSAPIVVRNTVVSVVAVANKETDYTEDDVRQLESFASSAQIVIERKKTEESLRIAEEKYRSIFENAVEGIFQTTHDGCYLTANPALARILGFDSPEDLLEGFTDIGEQGYVDHAKRKEFISIMHQHGIVENFEFQHYRKDGAIAWVSLNARAVRDDNGNVRFFEGTLEDITERKMNEEQLRRSFERLRKATGSVIDVIVTAVETKDPYTAGHQKRVANLVRSIAMEMGLSPEQIDGLRMAGSIHDLGKISIPTEILSMPRKLTALEYELIKEHPKIGYDIIKDIDFDFPVADIILQHHERLDGSGYPNALKGDDIMFEAKILAVADVVEAVASHRPYRAALGIDAAIVEITENAGILYDPEVVEICVKLFREKGFKLE